MNPVSSSSPRQKWLVTASTLLAVVALPAAALAAGQKPFSEWVHPGADGKLIYKTTPAGDRIMDFSHAGYMGGGVALPNVPVKRTVQPSGGDDDTAAIQAAIDEVSALPLENGFRGAVLLAPGIFTCPGTITIWADGVVLRGSGSGPGGSTIRMTGPRHNAITISANRNRAGASEPAETRRDFTPAQTSITDAYVPAGTAVFTVADAQGFAVGDTIAIRRPTTPAWTQFMEMHNLTRNGGAQSWLGTRGGVTERKITAISGNSITVDMSLSDSYNAAHLTPPGTVIAKTRPSSLITQAGVEHLRIQCPPLEVSYGQAPYSAIRLTGEDCWAKDVFCEETMNATVIRGKRITMQKVVVTHTYPNLGASKPTDFSIEGTEILLDRCEITGDNMYFVWTASLYPGPTVLLNCTFRGRGSRIQPHMRWSTGMLVDNCTVPDGGIDFMNRGVMGSGHGWTMGWAVAWNNIASTYVIQNPPGVANWAIGNIGQRMQTARPFDAEPLLPEGIFDSHGTPVAPQSLYLAQLSERLGPQALVNIGYASNSEEMFPAKSTPLLPPLRMDTDKVMGPDLAMHRPVNPSGVRGRSRQFAGENALDGDPATYWATDDNARRAALEVDSEGPLDLNAAVIEEFPGMEHVREYRVEGQIASDWKVLAQGTTIGGRVVHRFPKVTVWKVRLVILQADPHPAIRKFGIYLDTVSPPESFQEAAASNR